MTKSSNTCQSFRITAEALKLLGALPHFYVLFRKVIYIWVGLLDFREKQLEKLG